MIEFDSENREEIEILKVLVPQFPIYVLELSSLEDVKSFKSDLKHLFELYNRRNDKVSFCEYISENEQNWDMSDETWYVLSQLTHSKKMRRLIKQKEKGEEKEMCKALDDLVDDAMEEGRLQGREEGKAEGKAEIILELLEEYGEVPLELRKEIMAQSDLGIIKRWIRLASREESIEGFISHMHD